ncbi:Hypothetical protein GbCGDNIH9_5044 [Granulibacter bethesdensis]|uniref:Uncharacterized protein n=1 Tax=Granulibacter bethesdensis TaxID=364410 RepID=A0AAC9KE33_9PROT|nr:Hypothetical protein GbCGDNIH9_5044 [Granulibacter bethesdensis]APH63048.1 Hypothetical protein GbCGDNIH8_5044 [Granulibacter bethesdensis]
MNGPGDQRAKSSSLILPSRLLHWRQNELFAVALHLGRDFFILPYKIFPKISLWYHNRK